MSRALVTGATGFIGHHLVEALLRTEARVRCLVRRTSGIDRLERMGVEFVHGDVIEPASLRSAVANLDVVYHLAGITKALDRGQMMCVNEQGTRNIAEACRSQSTPPVLIVVSSLSAAGPSAIDRPRSEQDCLHPVSAYGRSKRAGEVAALSMADHVPTTIIRPPIVFGEGDLDLLRMIWPIVRFGIHPVPWLRAKRFSLIHADDLARALILAAERGRRLHSDEAGSADGYYFVAHDEHPTYAELGRRIARAAGRRKARVIRFPRAAAWATAGAAELVARLRGKPMIVNLDKAREAVAGSWTCSALAAREQLGFEPAASLDERLRQAVAWYREQGWV